MNPKIHKSARTGAFTLVQIMIVIAMLALFAAIAIPKAEAALQTQTDTNLLAAFSTNTLVLYGSATEASGSFTNGETPGNQQFIDTTKTTQAFGACGGFFTNTAASPSNIVFRIAATVDGVNWTNNAIVATVIVPPTSTNWAVTLFAIPQPYPIYGLRTIENTAAAGVTAKANTLYLKVWPKAGM